MEATIDPAKTLGKDILPRFEKTERYHQMKKRVEFLDTPVTSDDLVVPPPEYNAEYSQSLIKDDDYRYSLKVCGGRVHFLSTEESSNKLSFGIRKSYQSQLYIIFSMHT